MGVDTHLYLNSRWDVRDIIQVLERTQQTEVKVEAPTDMGLVGCFNLNLKERRIFLITNTQTPIGPATYLSLRANDESHKIFRELAEVLGGYFVPEDSTDKGEMINGQMDDEDALPYFLKHAILVDGIDKDNIQAFLKSIDKWYDKCDSCKKPEVLKQLLEASDGN